MKFGSLLLAAALMLAMTACQSNSRLVSDQAEQPSNVLLICIDDLRPELKSFGASYIHSPNIDSLAAAGRAFRRHYVNAPSCGPSRCTLLTGRYGPPGNNALFLRAKQWSQNPETVSPSMPEWFRKHGYTTVSVGKVSHHPGGRSGADWGDEKVVEMPNAWDRHLMPVGQWQHPRGSMHGLAHGEIRIKPSEMDVFQSEPGPDTIYPDGLITEEALRQLDELTESEPPFFLAVGIIKPHLPFGAPKKYMAPYENAQLPPIPHPQKPEGKTTWHNSGEFMNYNRWGRDPRQDQQFAMDVRKHYAACVSYADAQVGRLLQKLRQTGADKNTIVVVWGDHGWHLGEHAIWGKHALFEESLHAPLIICYPGISQPGKETRGIVETLDIFPTLCELTAVPVPEFLHGQSLLPMLNDPSASGHTAVAYRGDAATIRTDTHRLIVHRKGPLELYDHTTKEKETLNRAQQSPQVAQQLKEVLDQRLALKNSQE